MVYYTYIEKSPDGVYLSFVCTNRRVLSKNSKIPYSTLTYHFSRKGRNIYEESHRGIFIIRSLTMIRGNQGRHLKK